MPIVPSRKVAGKTLAQKEKERQAALISSGDNSYKRKEAARADIRMREKLASQTGATTKQAGRALVPTYEEQNRIEALEDLQAQKQKELQYIMETEKPEERSLAPEERSAEKIPVVGGVISTGENIIYQAINRGWLGEKLKEKAAGRFLSPETLKTEAKTEIERQVYEEGVTASEEFGSFVEGIPVVGSLVSKYVNGLIETPTGNIDTIMTSLKAERGRATKYETWARTGVISPEVARDNIEQIEAEVQELESRIKLLVNFSPELRYNSDRIRKLQLEILRTREVLFESKLRAVEAAPMAADDYAYYSALEQLNEGE